MYYDYIVTVHVQDQDDKEPIKGRILADNIEEAEHKTLLEAIKSANSEKTEAETLQDMGYVMCWPYETEQDDYERWGEYFGPWAEQAKNKAEVIIQTLQPTPAHVVLEIMGCNPLFELNEVI